MIGQPVMANHFFATASCTAMPPPLDTASPEKSSLAKSGLLTSALNSVLTAGNVLKRYLPISFTRPGMSRGLGMRMQTPPSRNARKATETSAKT